MPKLSDEQLQTIDLKELQEIVYELGIDEAYEIDDRQELIDYYLDWAWLYDSRSILNRLAIRRSSSKYNYNNSAKSKV